MTGISGFRFVVFRGAGRSEEKGVGCLLRLCFRFFS